MIGDSDHKDKNESRKIIFAIAALLVVLGVALLFMLPLLSDVIATHFTPGLNLKDAAVVSFFVTIIVLIIFAIASGDGLLGELQFILSGFFLFFMVFWLMIAWIF